MYILKFIFQTQGRILKTNIKYILIYKALHPHKFIKI